MASKPDAEMRRAATPSKVARLDRSTAPMDISSPDPVSFSRQTTPPLLSSKPRSGRKVISLFSDDTGRASSDGAAAKREVGDGSLLFAGLGGGVGSFDERHHAAASSPEGKGARTYGGGAGFTSPVRAASRDAADASRYTPQRNLGGLFASPLPPPPPPQDEQDRAAAIASACWVPCSADSGLSAPLLFQPPKREQRAPVHAASCVSTAEATSTGTQQAAAGAGEGVVLKDPAPEGTLSLPPETARLQPQAAAKATAPKTPSTVAALAPAIGPAPAPAAPGIPAAPREGATPVCGCGCSSLGTTATICDDLLCVSNNAFKSGEAMRTLEVVVKRERVGVNALASWRVAEFKRRLVHLQFFPTVETLALVPTIPLGGKALDDDVRLDTLDPDVAYRARHRPAVAAAGV